MIAHLLGTITEKVDNSVIIDVHGVGYEVALPAPDAEQLHLDDQAKIYTYHAIRENSEELYGFSTLAAKRLFELLLSVNGVGPKAAINILSLGPPETVRNAIANTDSAFIAKAAGVGKSLPNVSLSICATKLAYRPKLVKPPAIFLLRIPRTRLLTLSLHSVFRLRKPPLLSPRSILTCPSRSASN